MRDRLRGDHSEENAGGVPPTADRSAEPGARPAADRAARARRLQQSVGNGATAVLLARGGRALADDTRLSMEQSFGHSFADVRVHEDGVAESAGAEAVTQGSDIHFARGQFAPGSSDGKALLAHELTHVVQQAGSATPASATPREEQALEARAEEVGERVARGESVRGSFLGKLFASFAQPRKKKPPPPKGKGKAKTGPKRPKDTEITLFEDAKGGLFDDHDRPLGVRNQTSGKSFVGVDDKGKPVPLAQAQLGSFFDGSAHDVWRTVEVAVEAAPAPAPAPNPATNPTPPAAGAVDAGAPDASATAPASAPANGRTERLVVLSKSRAHVRDDGREVLNGNGHEPLSPAELARRGVTVGDGGRVEITGRGTWIWMPPLPGAGRADLGHWVQPERTADERRSRQAELDAEAKKLPAALQGDFTPSLLKQLAATAVVEGSFADKSGAGDSSASVGILQWAQPRGAASSDSMARFFVHLKQRADDAEAKAPADRSDTDRLFISAWKQVTDAGLDVRAGKLTIKEGKTRRDATGGEAEGAIAAEMGRSSLRTYQLIAAKDWIDQIKGTVIVPGPEGAYSLGLTARTYSDLNDGSVVVEGGPGKGHTLRIPQPAGIIHVGDRLTSERGIAMALSLGVNRPNYVTFALWRALTTSSDPKADFQRLMDLLWKGLVKKQNKHDFDETDIKAAGLDATFGELQALLWPTGTMDEAKLELEMKRLALSKYPKGDRGRRERRFATVSAAELKGPP